MNLTKTTWPAGWQPSADKINGDPNGLLVMNNLTLDNTGVVSLARGLKKISSNFNSYVDRIYSKNISGKEYLWISCGPIGQFNYRGVDTFVQFAEGTNRTCWGDAIGAVLMLAGQLRLKDHDGVTNPLPLGLQAAGTPTISEVSQTVKQISGVFTAIQGMVGAADANSIYLQSDSQASQGVALLTLASVTNTLDLGDGAAQKPDNDIIAFVVTPDDTSTITGISVDFIVGSSLSSPTDYYTYQIDIDSLLQGVSQRSVITPLRSEFVRTGSGNAGWDQIGGVRFTFKTTSWNSCDFGDITLVGGSQGQLNGTYTYIAQCVNDNGEYQAVGPCSAASLPVTVVNGRITVKNTFYDPQQTTHIWFYRGGGLLDQYYRVGIVKPGEDFIDTVTDDDAETLDFPLNPYLISTQPLDDGNGLNDDIFGVEGLMYGRMLYMTVKYLYISDFLNPDAIDTRYTLKASGDPSEVNLWIKKITNNVVILGTNKNLYEITGTFSPLPDGTIDIAINPIGEQFPPITSDVCAGEAALYYMGADGVRVTQGSNSVMLTSALRLLFEGDTRNGIAPVVINQYAAYSMAVGHGRYYLSVPTSDGKTYLWVWDAINHYWRLQYTDPVSVHVTVSGRVLLGYNLSSNTHLSGGLFQLDVGTGIQDTDGTLLEGTPFMLQTVYDSNGQPRNRKDTFTLKIVADTGGDDVDAYLAKDDGDFVFIGTVNHDGEDTSFFPLDNITLGFRYAIQLIDHNLVSEFFLYEATIEYDPRPEQNVYARIQPNNLGTVSRKRFINYAFVIDTLGNDVQFQPIVDGTFIGDPVTVNTTVKQTFIYYFLEETIGTDISGILTGGPFEFYQVNLEKIVSEEMPVPCKFLVIPSTNYGTPNRKRHSSYKFVINTRNSPVTFTPIIDGVLYPPKSYNTTLKSTVEYLFTDDTIGIDIGGTIAGNNPFEFYGPITPQTVEQLPDRLLFYKIPNTNLGSDSRKRFISYAFVIDTGGEEVTFRVLVDDAAAPPFFKTFTTNGKETVHFYFYGEVIGTDIGGTLLGTEPFEFYALNINQCASEVLPTPCEYLVIPANDYGKPNRKRHTSYKFQINTRGIDVYFNPIIDGVSYPGKLFNTTKKQTVEYFFESDTIGIDIGGTIYSALEGNPFEFYGVIIPQTIEVLPDRLDFYRIPNSNLGSVSRKRIVNYAFVVDTYGKDVIFIPLLDNGAGIPVTINTSGKLTYIYQFLQETIMTDIGGTLQSVVPGNPFEFYALNPEKIVSEDMPVPCKYLVIPANNYGTPNRKRHTSYKFQINTRGQDVRFTPILETNNYYPSTVYNTSAKQTVEYFFPLGDIIAIDTGGVLESLGTEPFEFYGVITPQTVEQLPDRLDFFRIPNTNLGVAARKRIRILPIVIDTYGQDVTFTPIVDGIFGAPQVLNTYGKITTFYYFTVDSFGVDYGATISANQPFEFYALSQPVNVEVLPVATKFDQLGPLRLDKEAKLFDIRVRLIALGTTTFIPFAIYGSNSATIPLQDTTVPLITGVIPVIPNIDEIYEVQLPKSVNTDVVRLVLGPTTDPFHRYDVKVRMVVSGMQTDAQWVPIR